MNTVVNKPDKCADVLLIGQGRLLASIGACLALSGSDVTILSRDLEQDFLRTQQNINHAQKKSGKEVTGSVRFVDKVDSVHLPDLVILTGDPDLDSVRSTIKYLEDHLDDNIIITIATDHIPLSDIQKNAIRPENILVMNWAEPAHTTFFLEIVHNEASNRDIVSTLKRIAINKWGKDPYVIQAELGIRGRMQVAMIREAMYLIEEGYANVEDIDRACRNDTGTYLPFAGHFQYMDLMGTYAYGVVMEKLNKELSSAQKIPAFFRKAIKEGNGMGGGNGFYNYTEDEMEEWEIKVREFSFEIKELIEKYP